jgi:hypothetical protein
MKNTIKVFGFAALVAVIGFAVISMIGCPAPDDGTNGNEGGTLDSSKAATPTANPPAGTYDTAQSVTLYSETEGAKIYYTKDGTEPTKDSTLYTAEISVSATTTIKAFAVKEDMNDSDILTAEYTILLFFTTAPELTLEPDNAKITYTWADSDPVADSYDVYWKEGSGLSAEEVKTSGTKIPGAVSGGEITGLTNGTTYSVIVSANKAGYAGKDSDVQPTMAGVTYIISRSDSAFTATKGGTTIGTAGQAIGAVFNAIRDAANGADCIIQFGNGTDILDIGTAYPIISGNWGAITLTGKITSAASSSGDYATIIINFASGSSSSVTSMADIYNTAASNGKAITINSYAALTIAGGTVSATGTNCVAVYHNSNSLLTIAGGTVSSASTTGRNTAVQVYSSTGTINISGGTVRATGAEGIAVNVSNLNSGKITVSGGLVTSEFDSDQYATIYLGDNAGVTDRLEITGGTVENTANGLSASAISNNSRGTVTISGGEVKGPRAINNSGIGYLRTVNITGGTISAAGTGGNTIYVDQYTYSADSFTTLNISGGTVLATGNGGRAVYIRTGTILNISGGTVRSETGCAVYKADSNNNDKITVSQGAGATTLVTSANTNTNQATIFIANEGYGFGGLEITGGTVENTSATTGNAIRNSSPGEVTISGGTVSATTGYAVYNAAAGKITISQPNATPTLITSANTDAAQATIFIASSGSATDPRLEMSGGTVANTSATTGNAIRNNSTGAVNITGGTVSKAGDGNYAVYKSGTGTVTIDPVAATIVGNNYGL